MKRLFTIAILLALPLAGCNRAAPAPDAAKKPNDTPPAATSSAAPAVPVVKVDYTPQTGSLISPQDVPLLEQINQENTKVLAVVLPSIVRITATMPVDLRMQFNGTPFHPPGSGRQPEGEEAFGSGVVISKDGYIVTNNHVVDGAKTVQVELKDKRTFNAHVVAADSPMDVAVLKIDAKDLPALPWGDSDQVQVGEQVFAIGNPFDLEDSASKGIVSAMRRQLPDSPGDEGPVYENFIQTDAAINPGNSGGALVNIHGELIGINTAIASTSRGNMGVGFAIPSNMVRYAVEGLIKDGRLVRGYLGVRFPDSVDQGVSDMLKFGSAQGALVAAVMPNSPAANGGLRSGDFITEVDGHSISGIPDLRLIVSEIPVGKDVAVKYIRDGTAQSTSVKIAELKPDLLGAANPAPNGSATVTPDEAPPEANVLSGLKVTDLSDKDRKKFGIDPIITSGVIVSSVQEGTPADTKSIGPGDVIESVCVDRGSTQTLTSAKEFTDLAKSLKSDQDVVLLVHHGQSGSFIYLTPPEK